MLIVHAKGLPWYAASQLLFKISRTMYIGAAVTHFFLWHGKTVFRLIRDSRVSCPNMWSISQLITITQTQEPDDPHYHKMKVYKEVPVRTRITVFLVRRIFTIRQIWWYVAMFLVTAAVAIGTAYAAKSGLPWWGLIVALIFSAAFTPVVGTVSTRVHWRCHGAAQSTECSFTA